MQKQNRTLRRSVERKVPGYVRVIVALLYAATPVSYTHLLQRCEKATAYP